MSPVITRYWICSTVYNVNKRTFYTVRNGSLEPNFKPSTTVAIWFISRDCNAAVDSDIALAKPCV